MLKLPKLLFTSLLLAFSCITYAQENDFCDAIRVILRDAPNKFRNIKGKPISGAANRAEAWECGIKIPGTIASRFINSMGLFYQGAVFQTKNLGELRPVYERYIKTLDSCLLPKGMTQSKSPNFKPGLQEYKKVSYLPLLGDDVALDKMPGHVALDIDYDKTRGAYTLIVFIYEH